MSSTQVVYWAGATNADAGNSPNQGIRTTLLVADLSSVTGALMAVWVSETMSDGSSWIQVGYFGGEGNLPTPFYQIWDLSANSVLATGYGNTMASGAAHLFSIYLQSGTVWAAAVDGVVLGTYDFKTAQAGGYGNQKMQTLVEEQPTAAPVAFPSVEATTAMEFLVGGVWSPAMTGQALEAAPYGVQGMSQNASLLANQIVVGSVVPTVSPGALLWQGGSSPTPTSLTLTAQVSP